MIRRNVTITEEQDEWLKENDKKLSSIVQKYLNKEIKGDGQ